MKVYHGSIVTVLEPLVHVGRKNLDFGPGFYVTDMEEQAISWAQRPMNDKKPHFLNIYEFDKEAVISSGYRYRQFSAYDEEWLDFVINNRRGSQLWAGFDVVEGGIANDRVFNTIELYIAGLILQQEALKRLQFEKPNNQICILKQEIVDKHLLFLDSVAIKKD